MSQKHPRPRWVPRCQTDANERISRRMNLKTWKLLKTTLVSIMIGVIALVSIQENADPTVIGGLAIVAWMAINGIEWQEWVAAREEIRMEASDDDDG